MNQDNIGSDDEKSFSNVLNDFFKAVLLYVVRFFKVTEYKKPAGDFIIENLQHADIQSIKYIHNELAPSTGQGIFFLFISQNMKKE
jgi:hypothetical protein